MKDRTLVLVGVLVVVVGCLLAWPAHAQDVKPASAPPAVASEKAAAPAAPTLTEVERLTLQNALLTLSVIQGNIEKKQAEIGNLQTEFEKQRKAAQDLMTSLQRPGYDIDLQRFEYVKRAETPKPAPAEKK